MNRFRWLTLLLAIACNVPVALGESRPVSLDELLSRVRQAQTEELRSHDKREQRFRTEQSSQKQRLSEIQGELTREQQRSDALQQAFDVNEGRLAELEQRLRERAGSLAELSGIFRQVWGDTRATLQDSLISTQLPRRMERLEQKALRQKLPSIAQMEELWFVLQQEMTESGRVASYRANVVDADGTTQTRQVTRVGPFIAVSGDRFLRYLPDTGELEELARQPAKRYRSLAANLGQVDVDIAPMVIDPSRGRVLDLLAQVPDLGDRILQGRLVGYIIIAITLIGLLIVLERVFHLSLTGWRMKRQLKTEIPDPANPLGQVMKVYQNNQGMDADTLELKLDEAILKNSHGLQRGLATIRILAVIAPMLGLLGTVTGLIETFQSITLFGTGDPRLMAGGISQALITTALGLTAAIPLILLHTALQSKSRRLLGILDEQSAGIIAAHAEGGERRAAPA
jgi:biopolymer transport protein ExbB